MRGRSAFLGLLSYSTFKFVIAGEKSTSLYVALSLVETLLTGHRNLPGMAEPTVLIIGAGTFGTSTAYHLSKAYKDASRITVIAPEQGFSVPPKVKQAASVDVNRVIRTDYPNPLYCNLAYESIHPWFWAIELGHHFHKTGWIMMDEKGSDLAKRIRQTFEARGSTQSSERSLEEMKERYDVMKSSSLDNIGDVYFNPEAGWCNATAATASFMQAAEKQGIKRITSQIKELVYDSNSRRVEGVVTSNGERIVADKVVLALGAWTSAMLSPIEDQLDIADQDRVERQARATGTVSVYYKLSEEEVTGLSKMPIIVYGGQGEVIPPTLDGDRLLKYNNSQTTFVNTITTSTGHKISVPADRSQTDVPEGIKRETEALLTSQLLPEFTKGKTPEYWRICWDAVTPTEDLLMCKHPNEKLSNLYLAVGGSFHGYKFVWPKP